MAQNSINEINKRLNLKAENSILEKNKTEEMIQSKMNSLNRFQERATQLQKNNLVTPPVNLEKVPFKKYGASFWVNEETDLNLKRLRKAYEDQQLKFSLSHFVNVSIKKYLREVGYND